ncbi:hypothetical protein BC828DRAFT_396909 [Blastocladiella britannica]|nr:hypothetical protein BC828DRAFT_396909 [Blastocladiella britannica]
MATTTAAPPPSDHPALSSPRSSTSDLAPPPADLDNPWYVSSGAHAAASAAAITPALATATTSASTYTSFATGVTFPATAGHGPKRTPPPAFGSRPIDASMVFPTRPEDFAVPAPPSPGFLHMDSALRASSAPSDMLDPWNMGPHPPPPPRPSSTASPPIHDPMGAMQASGAPNAWDTGFGGHHQHQYQHHQADTAIVDVDRADAQSGAGSVGSGEDARSVVGSDRESRGTREGLEEVQIKRASTLIPQPAALVGPDAPIGLEDDFMWLLDLEIVRFPFLLIIGMA